MDSFGVVRVYRVGMDVCLDPYTPGTKLVVLNCPVVGTDYLKERAPVIRTWSKVTEDGENIVLFSAPDSEDPLPYYLHSDIFNHFPELHLLDSGSGPITLAFGTIVEQAMIRDHSLIFFTNFTIDSEPDDLLGALGIWNCTISNSSGSDTALTTLSLCGKNAVLTCTFCLIGLMKCVQHYLSATLTCLYRLDCSTDMNCIT